MKIVDWWLEAMMGQSATGKYDLRKGMILILIISKNILEKYNHDFYDFWLFSNDKPLKSISNKDFLC